MKSEIIDWDSMGEDAKKLFAIPELSDEEIDDIAHSNMNLMKDEIYAFIEGMKVYREQLKQRE